MAQFKPIKKPTRAEFERIEKLKRGFQAERLKEKIKRGKPQRISAITGGLRGRYTPRDVIDRLTEGE